MPYWGPTPDENDFAFDSVGACIHLIKGQLMKDIATVLDKTYPEQSMVALLRCLRVIGEQSPKNFGVSFGRKDFVLVVKAFDEWVAKVGTRLPTKHREAIVAEARAEFALFDERILKLAS